MQRPGLCSKALIAMLVALLSAGPVAARPLLLPESVSSASQNAPRVGVVIVALDAPSAATQGLLEHVAEDSLKVAGHFELVGVADLFDPKAAADRAQKLEAARARMVEGQKHLDDLDTAKGTEAFADALKQLKETDTSRTLSDLIKAWVMKAAGHALAGEVAPAKQEIERIIAVQPKAEFNPQFFPPDLLKFVESQRRLSTLAKGELTVATEPPGGNVWVDGQLRGRSPVTVSGMLGGRHQVVASLGGKSLAIAELPPGSSSLEFKPAELAQPLQKAVDAIVKSPRSRARDAALTSLGKTLGVEQVLAVLVKKSATGEQFELTALRLEVKDGHNVGYATATLPLAEPSEALKGFFDGVVVTDAPRKGKEIVTHFDGDDGGSGGSGKVVVGVALLAVAAGLVGAGIGTGVVGQERYQQFRATPQVQTGVSQGYANEARLLGAVSLGSFIGAAVAAGVGIGVLASGGGGASEPAEDPKKASKRPAKKDEPKKADPAKKEEPLKKEEPKPQDPVKKDEPVKADPKEEKRRKEEEARRAKEEEARLRKEEEARARQEAEDKKRLEAEEKKRKEEEAAAAKKGGKKAEDAARKKAEEEAAAARKAEEEKKKKDAEEARRKEDEEKKRREEEEKKKKDGEDHDDLRNF
jgi:hypothetical protein